jgi:hypothetical protein
MNIIEILKEKYNLAPDSYYEESPYGKSDHNLRINHEKEYYLPFYNKWQKYTAENHYGCMGLGYPMVEIWYSVLDEFLEYVLKQCPDFKICQIAVKFGYIKIYLDGVTEDIKDDCWKLSSLLSDKFLIY